MAESDEHQETAHHHRRDWIDVIALTVSVGTLIVLAFTLRAVDRYTCEAHRQNGLLRDTLEVETRPYLGVGFVTPQGPPTEGAKLDIPIRVFDFGRRPAKAFVKALAVYSLDKLPNIDLTGVKGIQQLIWPPVPVILHAYTSDPVTNGQLNDIRAGHGWFYIKVSITYGDYQTDICTEVAANSLLPFNPANTELCAVQKSNCTDKDCK